MTKEEKQARLRLADAKGVGPATFKAIIEEYGSAERFIGEYEAGKDSRFNSAKLGTVAERPRWPLELTSVYRDEYYPKLLSEINDPPPKFYFRGDIGLLGKPCISIVGTRKNSEYGRMVTEKLVSFLVAHDFVIVSGMALGIDTIAHKAALAHGGKTIAVLGTPINQAYPDINLKLYEELATSHLIVSEYPPGGAEFAGSFAQRNRIIAAVSMVTVVVEAAARSGALITGNLAFDYNRYVYAVPGNWGAESSKGTNLLIRQDKAKLLTDPEQIIEELNLQLSFDQIKAVSRLEDTLVGLELEVAKNIEDGSAQFDHLLEYVKISAAELMQTLSKLELKGIIGRDKSGSYLIIK